jgi:hypothetical protein
LVLPPSWLKSFGITELDLNMFDKDVLEADESVRVEIIARREVLAMSLYLELGNFFYTLHYMQGCLYARLPTRKISVPTRQGNIEYI